MWYLACEIILSCKNWRESNYVLNTPRIISLEFKYLSLETSPANKDISTSCVCVYLYFWQVYTGIKIGKIIEELKSKQCNEVSECLISWINDKAASNKGFTQFWQKFLVEIFGAFQIYSMSVTQQACLGKRSQSVAESGFWDESRDSGKERWNPFAQYHLMFFMCNVL